MRTFVYVDGFNLYYRALKDTPYKWLNLKEVVRRILRPDCEIVKIKYFTALVLPTGRDPEKPIRQQTYLRAIETFIPEVEVHYGRFLDSRKRLTLDPEDQELAKRIRQESFRLGFAVLLKTFRFLGYSPRRKGDIPRVVVERIANQMGLAPDLFGQYPWKKRLWDLHLSTIREHTGFHPIESSRDYAELSA